MIRQSGIVKNLVPKGGLAMQAPTFFGYEMHKSLATNTLPATTNADSVREKVLSGQKVILN
jgi:hypothetical protein